MVPRQLARRGPDGEGGDGARGGGADGDAGADELREVGARRDVALRQVVVEARGDRTDPATVGGGSSSMGSIRSPAAGTCGSGRRAATAAMRAAKTSTRYATTATVAPSAARCPGSHTAANIAGPASAAAASSAVCTTVPRPVKRRATSADTAAIAVASSACGGPYRPSPPSGTISAPVTPASTVAHIASAVGTGPGRPSAGWTAATP